LDVNLATGIGAKTSTSKTSISTSKAVAPVKKAVVKKVDDGW